MLVVGSNGEKINIVTSSTDPLCIAIQEFDANAISMVIRKVGNDGTYKDWYVLNLTNNFWFILYF